MVVSEKHESSKPGYVDYKERDGRQNQRDCQLFLLSAQPLFRGFELVQNESVARENYHPRASDKHQS